MALIDNLVAYWSLDEASGNAIDAHGSNDLTETSGTIGATTGKVGGARDFEAGDTANFTISDNADLSMGDIDFSIAGWFNRESSGVNHWILAKGNSGTAANIAYSVNVNGSNRLRFLVGNGAGSFTELIDSTFGALSTGTWYFFVCYHDSVGNVLGMSINGSAAQTTACSHGSFNDGQSFTMGDLTASPIIPWDGLLDEIGIWKRVLSSDEITELYNSGNGRDYAYISGGAAAGVGKLTRSKLIESRLLRRLVA